MSLFLIIALPFLGALLPGLMIQAGRQTCFMVTFLVTACAAIGLATHAPAVLAGEVVTAQLNWLPQLGLNVNLFLDPLGLMFAGLILGIGLLIITYARFYLSRDDNMGEFYSYLLLFQGAMVGIVLSDNILMLLIFWELTSLSSFLLIGFWKHLPEGRQGARMALAVTGMGGLALIGGMLLLGQIAGSYDLTVILERRDLVQASPLYVPALILILLGCFTKSAQFPFHFWLPHAMAAPTPVSAYLHSATMVKAGLFLLARLWPVLAGTDLWVILVCSAGLITMVLGALIAIFKNDLKALLAFSTVSHLGLITFLLGTGTPFGAMAAVFHILNHASFKAALFMSAGIVDHAVHTRDMTRLGGLRKAMPITFVIATLAGLSMAGIPLLNGFLSKEMMLEEAYHTTLFGSPYLVAVVATLGALFSAAYSFRFISHTFLGKLRDDYPAKPHDPEFGLWLPPALLIIPVVLIGVAPFLAEPFVRTVTQAVIGVGTEMPHQHIKLWHGVVPALWMSVIAVGGGLLLLAAFAPLARAWAATAAARGERDFRPDHRRIGGAFRAGVRPAAQQFIHPVRRVFRHYSCGRRGPCVVHRHKRRPHPRDAADHARRICWLGDADCRNRVPGARAPQPSGGVDPDGHHRLMVSVGFNYFSAPDLALTQISVEVVTIMLLLLALNFIPNRTPRESARRAGPATRCCRSRAGVAAAGLIYAMLMSDFPITSISDYHLANSYKGGGGDNVVNVILVDFRGFDTFGEIIVLGIAALVIYALTESLLYGPVRSRLLNRGYEEARAGDAHPLMMVVLTRVMMPVILMAGVYIFLRGHNAPGGGFVAGLIVAIAVVMQYMASGFTWADKRQRYPYHGIIGAGVLVRRSDGIGAWFAGDPFLTSTFGYFRIPPLRNSNWRRRWAFDLGVFLAVVGAVMLSLESFSSLGRRAGTEDSEYADGHRPVPRRHRDRRGRLTWNFSSPPPSAC